MPIHDWTRVSAGAFHDLQAAWIVELRNAFNHDMLPDDFYSQLAQVGRPVKCEEPTSEWAHDEDVAEAEMDAYVRKQNSLLIHHSSDDRVVALIEILSPGNKAKKRSCRPLLKTSICSR